MLGITDVSGLEPHGTASLSSCHSASLRTHTKDLLFPTPNSGNPKAGGIKGLALTAASTRYSHKSDSRLRIRSFYIFLGKSLSSNSFEALFNPGHILAYVPLGLYSKKSARKCQDCLKQQYSGGR